jgi:hypothetical protein
MRATQFSRVEGMVNRASENPLQRAETCLKPSTSGYMVQVRTQKGIVRSPQGEIPLENVGLEGKIILMWISQSWI